MRWSGFEELIRWNSIWDTAEFWRGSPYIVGISQCDFGKFNSASKSFLHNSTSYTMNSSEKHLIFVEEYAFVVCRACKYGLAPSGILRHFRDFHAKTITSMDREQLLSWVMRLDLVQPNDVLVANGIETIKCLTVTDGYECKECGKLYGSGISMKKHCNGKHGWTTTQAVMWGKTKLQTVFRGSYLRYTLEMILLMVDISKLLRTRLHYHPWKC